MAFHNERLPEDVEKGVTGGPTFSTTVSRVANGFEQRNINFSQALGNWDLAYGILHKSDASADHTFTQILHFFYARRGMAHSFPFKDWSDFEIGVDADDDFESIGTGDGTTDDFQITKTYNIGSSYTYTRTITKPVSGTLRVFVAGVEKTETTHYTVDYLTGIITFTGGNTPTLGQDVAVITEFNVPVRFNTDHFALTLETFLAAEVPSIPIQEVRGE